MSSKFSQASLGAYRDAKAILELARQEGRIPPQAPPQPPMVGCEPPAWYKVDDMEKFLDALPPKVVRVNVVVDFLAWGCPVQRIPALDYFHALREIDNREEQK